MIFHRAIFIALRLTWPYLLTPWRSPLLRWRMETYGLRDPQGRLLHAEQIDRARFLQFLSDHRKDLSQFLRWAATI